MSWPRLILKLGAEALLCWNAYNYSHDKVPDWECWASKKRQPHGHKYYDEARNMTDEFTNVISVCFYICLAGVIISLVEMVNKKMNNKMLTTVIGVGDTIVGLGAVAWLVWASFIRLGREGKICAGATTNVEI